MCWWTTLQLVYNLNIEENIKEVYSEKGPQVQFNLELEILSQIEDISHPKMLLNGWLQKNPEK